ncbi:MAG: hypothetical protein ACR2FV_15040 [Ornithinimicrobium sp.]|uniref:hypothetical protein n=1 Tax=Ornithinimicrobium sp. TaxID=1977084 RepID=UPI00182B042F|nr:hypothetical protein [Actinomycetota bacterium]
MRMHDDQVDIDVADVRRAVVSVRPKCADAEVRPVSSGGTVVALFRVGQDLAARFPLVPDPGEARRAELSAEQTQVCRVAPRVSLTVPEPVAVCEPVRGYGGLAETDDWVRHSIRRSAHPVDPAAVTRAWEETLGAARLAGRRSPSTVT